MWTALPPSRAQAPATPMAWIRPPHHAPPSPCLKKGRARFATRAVRCAQGFHFPPLTTTKTNHDTQGHRPSDNEPSHGDYPRTNNLDIYDHHSTTHQSASPRRSRARCRRRSPRARRRRPRARATSRRPNRGPASASRATLARPCSTSGLAGLALGTTHAARAR